MSVYYSQSSYYKLKLDYIPQWQIEYYNHLPVKDVVDLLANVRTQTEKLAVDSVQNGFQEVTLSRVFAVEQL
jgi:hypothetical protein